jgi:hypothetical protein
VPELELHQDDLVIDKQEVDYFRTKLAKYVALPFTKAKRPTTATRDALAHSWWSSDVPARFAQGGASAEYAT